MVEVRELEPADAPALTALYEAYGWWDDRTVADVRTALESTEIALGIADDGDLVASARVLTDYTYYANVFDVVVATDRRGEGLGETLLTGLRDHPDLQSLPGLSLLCRRGLVPFYESVGFEVFDPETEIPEGDTEEMVRMTLSFEV